ncbi:MAG: hypothetical protein JW760_12565 [Spirochaetales bacterium]|nr:hypothetical protein [Spirochaetales bacterium]
MKPSAVFLVCFSLLLPLVPARGEQIRGTLIGSVEITSTSTETASFSLRLEDLAVLHFAPEDFPLIKGIEMEIRIPQDAESYMDGFACLVYHSIRPTPSSEVRFYQGSRLGYTVLPRSGRLYIQIPLLTPFGSSPSPGTILFDPLQSPESSPLILTLLPFMKGIPDNVYEMSFPIKVSPLVKEVGLLELTVKNTEGEIPEDLTVFIDDDQVDYPYSSRLLSPGLHKLHLEAPGYISLDRSFSIEKGERSGVSAVLEKSVPRFIIEAPRGSKVFLDGQQLLPPFNETKEIDPGEHTVLYTLGDYTLSRKFFAEPGKTYKIDLFLDILIENY